MSARSDNWRCVRAMNRLLILAAPLTLIGCQTGPPRIYPEAQVGQPARNGTSVYVYPPVPQVITEKDWDGLLSRYRGRPLVIYIWSARDPGAVPGLHEAAEVQAQYAGSRVLGLNLDPPDDWLPVVVPTLRQAGARFPCVSIPGSQRAGLLDRLGLPSVPQAVMFVVLDGQGRRFARRTAFELAGKPFAATQDTSVVNGEKANAAQPTANREVAVPGTATPQALVAPHGLAAERADISLMYQLRVVRVSDDVVVDQIRGVGRSSDPAQPLAASPAEGSEINGWLRMIGLQVSSHVKWGEKVAVAPVQYEMDAAKGAKADDQGMQFSVAVAEAVKQSGRGVVGPREVQRVCTNLGVPLELLAARPSSAGAMLGAAYLVTGTVTPLASSTSGVGP